MLAIKGCPLGIAGTGAGFAGDATYDGANTAGTTDRSTLLVGNALNVAGNAGGAAGAGAFAVSTLNTASLGNEFSVSAWFFVAADADTANQRHFVFEADNNYDVSFGTSNNVATTGLFKSYVGQGVAPVFTTLEQGQWNHVLHSMSTSGSNTIMEVYINGANTTSRSIATSSVNFPGLNFGMHRGETGRVLDGMMDEVAVWDRALTGIEATEVYNLGLAGQAIIGIPEPSSILMISMAAVGLLLARRRRRNG